MESTQQSIDIGKYRFVKYLSKEVIKSRILELGREIATDYKDKCPLFVIVLNGAFMFAADLVRAFSYECELQFVKLASYEGTSSTGVVKQIIGLPDTVHGRHIIIVEDIVDTGRTIQNMMRDLERFNPASVSVATLLLKPDCVEMEFESPYVGFEIPDAFVIGFGLDLDGKARNLDSIYQLQT